MKLFKKLVTAVLIICTIMLYTPAVSAYEGFKITAEFENETPVIGENKIHIKAINYAADDVPVTIVLALYEGIKLKETKIFEEEPVLPGETREFTRSLTVTETDANESLAAFFFENIKTIAPLAGKAVYTPKGFKFTVAEDCRTSAGVYDSKDRLIKTLWSGVEYAAGTYTQFWDGTIDGGQIAEEGNYKIKILYNNVECKQDCFIGNNLEYPETDRNFTGYGFYGDMVLAGMKMYTTTQYSEGTYGLNYFDIERPHYREGYLGAQNMQAYKAATDGERVYWASQEMTWYTFDDGTEGRQLTGFVHATNVSDNSQYVFENGQTTNSIWLNDGKYSTTNNVKGYRMSDDDNQQDIAYDTDDSRIGDVEVLKNGNILFTTYPNINKIYMADKLTGAPIGEFEIEKPRAMAVDCDDNLWLSYSENGVYKVSVFAVSLGGAFTLAYTLPQNFENPLALAVSPDGATIAVADGGSVNKVFAFDSMTGEVKWIFGSGESYLENPEVKDDKLLFKQYFRSHEWMEYSFLTFEDNNTLWVGDVGNYRARKFDISGNNPQITDSLEYLQSSYSCYLNQTDPTMLVSSGLEFEIDYSAEKSENSWKLKNNYVPQLEGLGRINGNRGIFRDLITIDGRTYFVLDTMEKVSGSYYEHTYKIFEVQERSLRDTGIVLGDGEIIRKNGAITRIDVASGVHKWIRKPFKGIDENGNPIWGAEEILAEIPYNKYEPFTTNSLDHTFEITSSNVLISHSEYSIAGSEKAGEATKLGGIDLSEGKGTEWMWKANPATSRDYIREYPTDGYYDIGNGVWSTSSSAKSAGRNIIHQYYGEGYRGAQANFFTHFYDNGLFIGRYGDMGKAIIDGSTNPGNGFSWNFIENPENPDEAYIYQNDESRVGAVHRYKISGLSSIKEENIDISLKWCEGESSLLNGVLKCEMFSSSDIDSAELIKSTYRTDFTVTAADEAGANSLRFSGYIKPPAEGSQRFVISTSGNVRLKIDGNTVMEGQSGNVSLTLDSGRLYPIELELTKKEGVWGEIGFYLNRRPNKLSFEYLYTTEIINQKSANLLEGLPYSSRLENTDETETNVNYIASGKYGWSFYPELGNSDSMSLWKVSTNASHYKPEETNDIYISSRIYGKKHEGHDEPRYALRNLGSSNNGNWSLDAEISIMEWLNYTASTSTEANHGQFIDVLDVNGKIIARFYAVYNKSDEGESYDIYGNGTLICRIDETVGQYVTVYTENPINAANPLKISVSGDIVKFEFMGNTAETAVLEEGALPQMPQDFRVLHFNERNSSANVAMITNITKLNFGVED